MKTLLLTWQLFAWSLIVDLVFGHAGLQTGPAIILRCAAALWLALLLDRSGQLARTSPAFDDKTGGSRGA